MANASFGNHKNAAPPHLPTALATATAILALATLIAVASAVAWGRPYAITVALLGAAVVVVLATATAVTLNRIASAAPKYPPGDDRQAGDADNLARARFIADASHDLRQPLHALGLFLDSLERRVTPGEGVTILAKAREAAVIMGRMFDALIELTRVDADALIPEVERFELDALLARLESERHDPGPAIAADFRVVRSSASAIGDERLTGRICATLLSNLTALGPSRLLLGVRHRAGQLCIEMHRSGPGGSSSKWAALNATPPSDRKGLDLDLLVARRLADLLQLELRVVSATDRGTVLTLSVPRAKQSPPPPPLTAVAILLIADDAARRRAAEIELASAGAVVHVAGNVGQAEFAARHNRLNLIVPDLARDDASARATANRVAPALPVLANRTTPDQLIAAACAALGSHA